MSRLDRNAEPVELALSLRHEGEHPGRNGAEVVIFELLTLGGLGAEQRALADEEIGPLEVEVPIDQEVLLLRPDGGEDTGHTLVGPENLEDPDRLL